MVDSDHTVIVEDIVDPISEQRCLILPHHDPPFFQSAVQLIRKLRHEPSLPLFAQTIQKIITKYECTYFPTSKRKGDVSNLKLALASFDNERFVKKVMPLLCEMVINSFRILESIIRILRKGTNSELHFTQQQVLCLVACMFFCVLPPQFFTNRQLTFKYLFSLKSPVAEQKIKFILGYFCTVYETDLSRRIIIVRRHGNHQDWYHASEPILIPESKKEFYKNEPVFVDFANKNIGGGVLGKGYVQEQVLFLQHPQALVSILTCQQMQNDEVIFILGLSKYSNKSLDPLKYKGPHKDTRMYDDYNKRITCLIAMDALNFNSTLEDQFSQRSINRQLNKAFLGFQLCEYLDTEDIVISTGLWGCGVFRGNLQLKILLQIMAASVNMRKLVFHSCEEREIAGICAVLDDMTVGQLYQLLTEYRYKGASLQLWDWIFKYGV